MDTPLRILITDDQPRTRRSLRALLSLWSEVEVVGEAATGQEAVDGVAALRPDVVVMDVHMPGMDGLEATRRIKREWPQVKVLILSMDWDRRAEALQAGADTFLVKGGSSDELVHAVLHIAQRVSRPFEAGGRAK